MWPLAKARSNKTAIDWTAFKSPAPKFIGRRVFKNFDLAELARYIDWGPFFQTWDLAGPYPAILKDAVVGVEAQKVFNDAQKMLQKIIEGRWITAHGVIGLYPANSVNHDDIALYADEARETPVLTWHGLRQQTEKQSGKPSRCLADFMAPLFDAQGKPTQVCLQSQQALVCKSASKHSKLRTTTTAPSCSRPWPIDLQRPSQSACTREYAKIYGAMPRKSAHL
jgi:cobalamin-dependent methionine synthase I